MAKMDYEVKLSKEDIDAMKRAIGLPVENDAEKSWDEMSLEEKVEDLNRRLEDVRFRHEPIG